MSMGQTGKDRVRKLAAEWKETPPVSDNFPFRMRGGSTVDTFKGVCARCDEEIPDLDLRGTVVLSIPTVLTISAVGYCRKCACLTPYQHRVRAVRGGLQSEWIDQQGRWVKMPWKKEGPPGLLSRLVEWLKRKGFLT